MFVRTTESNVYLLSAVPLTNYAPSISHIGVTIPCSVTAVIGIAFLLTRLHATSPISLDIMPMPMAFNYFQIFSSKPGLIPDI